MCKYLCVWMHAHIYSWKLGSGLVLLPKAGNTKGGSITVLLTSCLTGLESAVWQQTIFCFYLQNRLIQTSQTGGQWYSDPSPFSIPCLKYVHDRWLKSKSHYCTCLGHIGWHNTDRIIPIGQGKYSSNCCMLLSLTFQRKNFANVQDPL